MGKWRIPLLYPLLGKDLFVAVKPDVAGFYLFEFKNEQAKKQVLE